MLNIKSDKQNKEWIPALDGIRSIAIILVLLRHIYDNVFPSLELNPWYQNTIGFGWIGVYIFFALSGFLVGGSVLKSLDKYSFSPKEFIIKRIFRIMPTAIAVIIFTGGKELGFNAWTLKNITLTCNVIDSRSNTCLQNYWSLCTEEHFYLALCIVAFLLAIFRVQSKIFTIRGLVCLVFAHIIVRYLYLLNTSAWNLPRITHSLFHIDAFLMGMIAWRLYPLASKLKKSTTNFITILVLAMAIPISFLFHDINLSRQKFDNYILTIGFFHPLLYLWCSSIVLIAASFKNKLTNALGSPIFSFLALISYSMYLSIGLSSPNLSSFSASDIYLNF